MEQHLGRGLRRLLQNANEPRPDPNRIDRAEQSRFEAGELQRRNAYRSEGGLRMRLGAPVVFGRAAVAPLGLSEGLDYEALLALGERLGEVKRRGASQAQIDAQLPLVSAAAASAQDTTQQSCAVCMEDYAEADQLRELPCGHRFHQRCGDQWLRTNAVCPVCRTEAVQGQ